MQASGFDSLSPLHTECRLIFVVYFVTTAEKMGFFIPNQNQINCAALLDNKRCIENVEKLANLTCLLAAE